MRDPELPEKPGWRLAVPFVAVGAIGLISASLPPDQPGPAQLVAMWLAFAAVVAMVLVLLRVENPGWLWGLPPLAFLGVVALVRDATGATASGVPSLVGLPLLWLAITGTRQQLRLATVGVAAVFVVPMVLVGAPDYPLSDWRRAALWTLFAGLVTPVVQSYVRRLIAAEARWRVLVEHLPDTTVVLVDERHRVRLAAGAGARSQRLESTTGHHLSQIRDPHNRERMLDLVDTAIADGQADPVRLTSSRTGVEHEVRAVALPGAGGARMALVVAHDLASERAVVRANQRSEQLFADAPHGIVVLDESGAVVRANGALAALLGTGVDDLVGRRLRDLVRPGLRAHTHLARAVDAGEAVSDDFVLAGPDDGRERTDVVVTTTVLPRSQEGRLFLSHVVDVSERRRYEARLAHMADHDDLTGLANRRRFDEALAHHHERCAALGAHGAVLLLDLDDFKLVNDTVGHGAGDEMLVGIADLLRSTLRPGDTVARLGGDEFAILLRHGDAAALAAVARGVIESVAAHTALLDGARRRVTASGGLVTFAAAAAAGTDILALADMTMYDAKDSGRDRVVVLGEDGVDLPHTTSVLHWKRRIAEALDSTGDSGEFELVLQPVVSLRGGGPPMAEVLLRLRDDGRLVPPGEFLHIAERSGQAARVDAWVIRHAIALLDQLDDELPDLRLAINLSGLSIGDPTVEEQLVRSLREHQVDPSALVLEITETAAVGDLWRAREFTTRIADLGCRFALDDFGSGFGSFSYLKHLPFDYVKIDGEFIADLRTSSVNRVLLRSLVSISDELGKTTIAEHVGDDWTLDFLRREGVAMVQGFHVAEPAPPAELAVLLRAATLRVDAGEAARLW